MWRGELSSSALSTALAAIALTYLDRLSSESSDHGAMIRGGMEWLARSQNEDGGYGDTVRSFSNLSTTCLVWAAFRIADGEELFVPTRRRIENWLSRTVGGTDPESLAMAVLKRYGKDHTFSVPILTVLSLAGALGPAQSGWRRVRPLPFELSVLPRAWFRWLRLQVVSYALPALIAIGQVRHHQAPSRNPLVRGIRSLCRRPTLRLLERLQPDNGGFLEAVPLTSFVMMSLLNSGSADSIVVRRGAAFLEQSVRSDGSWPIDTDLATWVTTLSVKALAEFGQPDLGLSQDERRRVTDWLRGQQFLEIHPYTGSAPGAWSWTDLPGAVPDADDTAGALVALHLLNPEDESVQVSAKQGVQWLLDLQNSDGGIPTFCRGWGKLPFDRSSAELTAHALLAWDRWRDTWSDQKETIAGATGRAIQFLKDQQRPDGTWVPLWFGNQFVVEDENPVYGTARVLFAIAELNPSLREVELDRTASRGVRALLDMQNEDGGWGGGKGAPSSVEETALVLHGLSRFEEVPEDALQRGEAWLRERWEKKETSATPIGFYFAKLWYFEDLYPVIFTAAAVGALQSRSHERTAIVS